MAASNCARPTNSLSWRAAISAASLQMFAMSAPDIPGVREASRWASSSCFSLQAASSFSGWRCSKKMLLRAWMSGFEMAIWRSKRPGRSRALSRMSARLVPASTTTPAFSWKPSISTSSWLSVFSRSSLEPEKPPSLRALPMASISSIQMMHGAFARACLKRSRTRAGPTPTNISMKSEPDVEKKGTFASPAVAFASSVLPVPGGPTRRAPLGILAPKRLYCAGSLRKWTNSLISCLASSRPATSP
mmetsp:Transcript_15013/g.58854  ORF Transcript_15013/g.58854 Transcript_15013/m.58854 type:complete len:246 (+) Transcript_15013:750-1487(+)